MISCCVGMFPIDGLILMWHIPTELSSVQSRTQSKFCLSKLLARVVILLIVKLGRGFSQLLFVNVLFAFNIFLITYFCVRSSIEPPLDHNMLFAKNEKELETLIQTIKIYSQDMAMEFGIKKSANIYIQQILAIYMCVCVCVCVYLGSISSLRYIWLNSIDIFCLHISVLILSSHCMSVIISGWNCLINLRN